MISTRLPYVKDNRIQFDEPSQNLLVIILMSQLFFTNGIYLFLGAIIFGILFSNLQQAYKPTVFTIIFMYHFLQISAGIWLSNYLGYDINYRSNHTSHAIVLSYIGLLFLLGPVIYFQNKIPNFSYKDLQRYAEKINTRKVFIAYIIAFFVTNILSAVAFSLSGLTQIIFSIIKVKWFLFVLFGFCAILKKDWLRVFIACAIAEFLSGFFSYFSEFKDVVFFSACLMFTLLSKVNIRQMVITIIGIVVMVYLGIFWTVIKGEYRQFLNQGSKTQTVQVSEEEAITKLIELIQNGRESYQEDAFANFLDRLQYTYHFAKTIDNVPALLPHEYGSNWGSSISYALTPRAFNPDKPIFEATIKTRKYTGLAYAGHRQGASFSLGYFADGYIDFGMIGMFFPILIIGLIYGNVYFFFVRKSSPNILFNYAVVAAIFMEFIIFEVDSTKLVGRLFATLLTFYMLKIFFFPWLYRYFTAHTRPVEAKY